MIGRAAFLGQVRLAPRSRWTPHLGQSRAAITPSVVASPAAPPATWLESFVRRMEIAGAAGAIGLVIYPLDYLFYPHRRFTRREGFYSMIFGAGVALISASIPAQGRVFDYISGVGGVFSVVGIMDQVFAKKTPRKVKRSRVSKT